MENTLPEALQPIVGLAKARELLIMEAQSHMPKGAKAQRDKMVATLGSLIADSLAATAERLPVWWTRQLTVVTTPGSATNSPESD